MATTHNQKIGIVSGIGPLAGSDVLSKVLTYASKAYGAHEDSEYPEIVLLSHGIDGFDDTAELTDTFKTGVIETVLKLESWGATIIGIACNTAHIYLPDIHLRPETMIINLPQEVTRAANEPGVKYGLLTSRGTKDEGLYKNLLNESSVTFVETTEQQQVLIDKVIDKVMAHTPDDAVKEIESVINEMQAEGVTHFIAGCTELPIAINYLDKNSFIVIDSNEVLAKQLVDTYYTAIK